MATNLLQGRQKRTKRTTPQPHQSTPCLAHLGYAGWPDGRRPAKPHQTYDSTQPLLQPAVLPTLAIMQGGPMAANLLKAGLPVLVFDRNPAAVEKLKRLGAKEASSPQEIASTAGVHTYRGRHLALSRGVVGAIYCWVSLWRQLSSSQHRPHLGGLPCLRTRQLNVSLVPVFAAPLPQVLQQSSVCCRPQNMSQMLMKG
jgi:hypothetical protein